jgi:hypothetical protein
MLIVKPLFEPQLDKRANIPISREWETRAGKTEAWERQHIATRYFLWHFVLAAVSNGLLTLSGRNWGSDLETLLDMASFIQRRYVACKERFATAYRVYVTAEG